MSGLKEIPSGWVKGSLHKRADWHWWVGGVPVDEGFVRGLCGYSFSVMAGVEGQTVGMIERQDFPPAHWMKPTCYQCKKMLKKMIADYEKAPEVAVDMSEPVFDEYPKPTPLDEHVSRETEVKSAEEV